MPDILRFCSDVHLGKLSRLLRMCGFDTIYENYFSKDELLKIARDENRCLLSKSPYFLKFQDITFYQIKSSDSNQQLKEVVEHFQMRNAFNPFVRCLYCNEVLEKKRKRKLQILFCLKQKKISLNSGNALPVKRFFGRDHIMKG